MTGLAVAAQSGAVSASGSSREVSRVVREQFRLVGTDGATFSPNFRNYAARTSAASPLLLFLPATRERPSNYTAFLSTARKRGFHVLALDYWNQGLSVQKTCGMNSACYTDVQRNRLDGSSASVFSSISRANSIVTRLATALEHLQQVDPHGGWGQFTTANGIDWRNIVVAGHSQGGGESAYISHIHRVLGVLMFSSPVDSDAGISASWMGAPGATPASAMYGFDDTRDIFADRIRASWNALGMGAYGPAQNVTFGVRDASHELITTTVLGSAMRSHSLDITDAVPRGRSGRPIFENVWGWMLDRVLHGRHLVDS